METGQISYQYRNVSDEFYKLPFLNENVCDMEAVTKKSDEIINGNDGIEIVDCRPEGRFLGKVAEPRPNTRSGSIPGSKHLFFKDLVNEDWTMKSDSELKELFLKGNIDLQKELITTCGSGLTAALANM